ncbi:unnamed protein product [Spirodela intermedia]|uniref:SET domain-containing protein n=1 Tax=Spirodela intermedia TaxID=51605 RepID=A0A7I8JP06_SPIIN|nr:unnamed protein product [Spirodela intermedia]CAA6671908.1 unnamed protein product [Spirodela intermedia]
MKEPEKELAEKPEETSVKEELEKEKLVPDKGRKGERENSQEDYYRRKVGGSRRESEQRNCEKGEFVRDKRQKGDRRRTPDDFHRRKEGGSRIDGEQRKRSSLKSERMRSATGKYHGKDHNTTSSQKKHCIESENSTRKHHGEFAVVQLQRSEDFGKNTSRSGHQDKLHGSSTVSSRSSSTNKYSSSRRHDSPLPSRAHDRHAQKPASSVQNRHDPAHQHNHRNRSPVYPDRSPCDQQERTPSCLERSPNDRGRHRDYRDRTPSFRDRSPHDRVRHHGHRDRTPSNSDRSPQNSGQVQEAIRKGGSSEKHHGRREEKPRRREPDVKDSAKHSSLRESSSSTRPDKVAEEKLPPPPPVSPPPLPPPPPPPSNGFLEDHLSMEEDMDICDTPPLRCGNEKSVLTVQPEMHLKNDGIIQNLWRISRLIKEWKLLDGHDIIPGRELETIGEDGTSRPPEGLPRERSYFPNSDSSDWFAGRWSCKGGDWRRNDDNSNDRCQKENLFLMKAIRSVRCRKQKLDLPTWNANDSTKACYQVGEPDQDTAIRGVKGTVLPVVRINACVVRDHTFCSEPRPKVKSNERHSRSSRSHSAGGDKSSSAEVTSQSKNVPQSDSSIKKQRKFAKGAILKHSSVFRKADNVWIPVTKGNKTSRQRAIKMKRALANRSTSNSVSHNLVDVLSFNNSHPQYIGYTRGKLHELVMKSYKSREFAAAINEVLDPWINAKQPKREREKTFPFQYHLSQRRLFCLMQNSVHADADGSGSYGHVGKRARRLVDESDEDREQEDNYLIVERMSFHLRTCGRESWGMLSSHILARIFHFLRTDTKSLILSAATCKHWRAAVQSYKNICKQVDLSFLGSSCTDSVFQSIMSGYDKNNISSMKLSRCSNISATALEEILQSFTSITSIDIRGCNQFKELILLFQNVKWIKSRSSQNIKNLDESYSNQEEAISDRDDLGNSKDPGVHTFRQGYYKRTRVPDALKSSSALTRHAQLRQLLRKKSVTAYRKWKNSLVAEIEDKIRNGHYGRHGLNSVKEDISRMYAKVLTRQIRSRTFRSFQAQEKSSAIDQEIKKSLSKLNRRHMDSESETSEENDLTEYDTVSDSDGKTSDTESELDSQFILNMEESLDSIADDREWGARMTKASLVPPVTRKYEGLGVVCNKDGGFGEDDFVVEFLGEVYPAWKWFEKQDGIRSLQKNNKDPAPEFYNIYLERPKGDRDGYDLVVVDAMHKANYASRICHSCRPNCEAKVTAVDGQYQIGIYALRPIAFGEEITFDYNSVTESKEEYEASVCLCGSQVLKERHGLLDRHKLMLESCEANFVSQEDYIDLGRAGLGTCLLAALPDWLIAYSARLVRFMNFERTKLPEEILKHNLEEKRKFFTDICLETEKIEAENQAEGVYNQRLQNLALTLDKVRYVMRCAFGDPKKAPPPLERVGPEMLVASLWTAEDSLVEELLQCLSPHLEPPPSTSSEPRSKPAAPPAPTSPPSSGSLSLRDELRAMPCSHRSRNDAAADLIHLYAHTKCFFRVREYKAVKSPPVYISPLDLGPKYVEKMGPGFQEYCKSYGENYCLGQLIFWHNQTSAEPDCSLARARRGCLVLPDVASFYASSSQRPPAETVYGPRTVRFMLARMVSTPLPSLYDPLWRRGRGPRTRSGSSAAPAGPRQPHAGRRPLRLPPRPRHDPLAQDPPPVFHDLS